MPDSAVTAAPFVVVKPLIRLGAVGSGVTFECGSSNVDVSVDQDENTVETFCGVYTSFKAPKWMVTITLAQSYGANGTWTLIKPLCNTIVPFAIKADAASAASVSNPVMVGTCMVKWFPMISAGPGEISEVDLELAVQGQPTFQITEPTMLLADAEQTAAEGAELEPQPA